MKPDVYLYLYCECLDSAIISDLDWCDSEYFMLLEKFKSEYDSNIPLIFIAHLIIDFMAEFMDCPSCPLREEYFEEFYKWLLEKEKYI